MSGRIIQACRAQIAALQAVLAAAETALVGVSSPAAHPSSSPSHPISLTDTTSAAVTRSTQSLAASVAIALRLAADPSAPPSSWTYGDGQSQVYSAVVGTLLADSGNGSGPSYPGSPSSSSSSHATAALLALSVVEKERVVANAVARRLGLPSRFLWVRRRRSGASSSPSSVSGGDAANARLFLWGPAVRTSDGAVPLIPQSPAAAVAGGGSLMLASPSELFGLLPPPSATPITTATPTTSGGGVLHSTALESYLCLLHTARTQALSRCLAAASGAAGSGPASLEERQRHERRLTLYCSDQADPLLLQAAGLVGIAHTRVMQTVMTGIVTDSGDNSHGGTLASVYRHSPEELKRMIVEDLGHGLYPCLVVGTYGSPLGGGVDPLASMAAFCARAGVWFHVDVGGSSAALLSTGGDGGREAVGEGEPAALTAVRAALSGELAVAAALADSVLLLCAGAGASGGQGLPSSVLPGGDACASSLPSAPAPTAILFLSHVQKLRWALRLLLSARHQSGNHLVPPPVPSDGSADQHQLPPSPSPFSVGYRHHRLVEVAAAPQGHRDAAPGMYLRLSDGHGYGRPDPAVAAAVEAAVAALAAAQLQGSGSSGATSTRTTATPSPSASPLSFPFPTASAVRAHQGALWAAQSALQGDGRLDCALAAGPVFGRLFLRLLTQADEATAAWAGRLAERVAYPGRGGGDGGGTATRTVRVYVSLVVLQKRLWVCLSISDLEAAGPSAAAAATAHLVSVVKQALDDALSG